MRLVCNLLGLLSAATWRLGGRVARPHNALLEQPVHRVVQRHHRAEGIPAFDRPCHPPFVGLWGVCDAPLVQVRSQQQVYRKGVVQPFNLPRRLPRGWHGSCWHTLHTSRQQENGQADALTTHATPKRTHAATEQSASNLDARIVVALDGSARAALVLPYVEALAEQFGSAVILLRATTPAEAIAAPADAATMPPLAPNIAATPIDPGAVIAAERRAVESYLGALAQRLRSRGLAVSHEQQEGAAVDVIIARARDLDASLEP